MTTSLLRVKKEIRILGLDRCNSKVIVGAIARGGFFLDGVTLFPKPIRADALAEKIRATKYYPELKAMMLHGVDGQSNIETIERITALPTVAVALDNRRRFEGTRVFRRKENEIRVKSTLDSATLERIFALTWVREGLPEPLRIAHLLTKLHILGSIRQDKG